jgi:hypothetical protein
VPSDESKKREKLNGLVAVECEQWRRIPAVSSNLQNRRLSIALESYVKECIQAKNQTSDHHTGQQLYA